jgi:hypothetical protein
VKQDKEASLAEQSLLFEMFEHCKYVHKNKAVTETDSDYLTKDRLARKLQRTPEKTIRPSISKLNKHRDASPKRGLTTRQPEAKCQPPGSSGHGRLDFRMMGLILRAETSVACQNTLCNEAEEHIYPIS